MDAPSFSAATPADFRDISPFTRYEHPGHALMHFVSRPQGAVAYFLNLAKANRKMAALHPHARRGYLQMARHWTEAARTYRLAHPNL